MDLHSYDKYIVAFSGGKDSTAALLHLIDRGVSPKKIELHHHDIDGREGSRLMDWPCTRSYCKAFADAFKLPLYYSWKEGGFEREMLRQDALTAPIWFETPDGLQKTGGERGKAGTRLKFPQVSADLSVRWCSAYLKIDVMATAIRNQERFSGLRTLVITGERGEESKARAGYSVFEPDRAHSVGPKSNRHVDHWRPIRDWSERDVWNLIELHEVRVHPAYYLGWGRVSCMKCIFGSANQWASAAQLDPDGVERIAVYEDTFGCTIKRSEGVRELVAKGKPYDWESIAGTATFRAAMSDNYDLPIIMAEWELPAGAFGESCGPS